MILSAAQDDPVAGESARSHMRPSMVQANVPMNCDTETWSRDDVTGQRRAVSIWLQARRFSVSCRLPGLWRYCAPR